jgi:hypothetical protein
MMKYPIHEFCLILAILLFGIASVGAFRAPDPWPWHGRLIASGLFFWSLSTVITA